MHKYNENQQKQPEWKTEPMIDYATTPSLLYQSLRAIWAERLEEDDLELLDVSLYHLFHNLNLVLQEILPQLAEICVQAEANEQIYMQQRQRYQRWLWLSEMQHRLERIEPLCQIIIITITHLLATLEANELTTLQKSPQLFTQAQHPTQRREISAQEFTFYMQCLQSWQELNVHPQKLQAFEHLFSDLVEGPKKLEQIDIILTQMYQSACIVFSEIFQHSADTSALLLLLLNIQQHADLLQMQIDMLLTPLYTLRKQAAFLIEQP